MLMFGSHPDSILEAPTSVFTHRSHVCSPATYSSSFSSTINQLTHRDKEFLPAVIMKPLCFIVVRAHLGGDHRSNVMDELRIKAGC